MISNDLDCEQSLSSLNFSESVAQARERGRSSISSLFPAPIPPRFYRYFV